MSIEAERLLRLTAIRQQPEFLAFRGLPAALSPQAGQAPALLRFWLRLELEAQWLRRRHVAPALAELAAARAASQFILADGELLRAADHAALPGWVRLMAAEAPPAAAELERHFDAPPEALARLRRCWTRLGTADALMETGGDIRLARDPGTALNGYGASHRPRPWAITFASSTASSSSERGYLAADLARLAATAAMLREATPRAAVRASLGAARRGITRVLGLPAGTEVILAASGTDTELLALGLTHLGGDAEAPVLSILIAPEETGRGVPMAARGLHFAVDTARGHDVAYEQPINGYRADTALARIALRDAQGALRDAGSVEREILGAITAGIAAGRRIILHALDLSKTGLLAPRPDFLAALREQFGAGFDVVVDACQARLSPGAIARYLALDAVVLITGSKFFTGPPFAGAALVPARIAARLGASGRMLPVGLDAYFGRDDFFAPCPAARALPAAGNYGLALRWHAALGEMRAFFRIPQPRRSAILGGFGEVVRRCVAKNLALTLLEAPAIARHAGDEAWEVLPSIFTFALRAPDAPDRWLTPDEARRVYLWLNTDLSRLLPEAKNISARICHIGQPVPLPAPGGGLLGALRVSAGARLIAGEPSHLGLSSAARVAREFADLATVFDKIALILEHWKLLAAANPAPRYRPDGFWLTRRPAPVTL